MKKLNVYASANSENHIRKHGSCIVTDHQPDEAQLRPSLLLIAEDGEQLPEVMTKEEHETKVGRLVADLYNAMQDGPYVPNFEAFRKAAAQHGITL